MPPFLAFILKTWFVVTWIAGFVGLALLPDEYDLAIENFLKITAAHIVYSMAALSFLYMAYGVWREFQRTLPPQFNPWKKQALRNLVTIIESQLEVGHWLMGPSFSPVDAARAIELNKLRTALRDLEITFPNAAPGDLPRWNQWVGFLYRLQDLAIRGDIKAARLLNDEMASEALQSSQDVEEPTSGDAEGNQSSGD